MASTSYQIRFALPSDVPSILALVNELAAYEKASHEVHATEEKLLATLSFPTDPSASSWSPGYARTFLISSADSTEVAGMAMYFFNYSTWHAAPGIYLEDLFVKPEYRGKGYGTALLRALAAECVKMGAKRLDWSVLTWNEPSIKFYEGPSVGALRQSEWMGMRVEGDRLIKLAESAHHGV